MRSWVSSGKVITASGWSLEMQAAAERGQKVQRSLCRDRAQAGAGKGPLAQCPTAKL